MRPSRLVGGGWRIWAVVPFKGPVGSKRRLAGLLNEDERARLSLAMLDDVLETLLTVGATGIERVLLLAPATSRMGNVKDHRLLFVGERSDAGTSGSADDKLNGAIGQAQDHAEARGVHGLLIVPGDLPLVRADDIAAVLDAARTAPVVIAPDRAGGGTNALFLTPPSALPPSFGEASFQRHRTLAESAGLTSVVVERPGLALDLDTPADVELLLASDRDSRATRLLHQIGVERHLATLAAVQARSTTI